MNVNLLLDLPMNMSFLPRKYSDISVMTFERTFVQITVLANDKKYSTSGRVNLCIYIYIYIHI